jgi:hypothetical protein
MGDEIAGQSALIIRRPAPNTVNDGKGKRGHAFCSVFLEFKQAGVYCNGAHNGCSIAAL